MSHRLRESLAAEIELQASNWILRRDAGFTPEEDAEFRHWQQEDSRHAEAVLRKEKAWRALCRPLRSGQAELIIERLAARAATRRRRRIGAIATGVVALFVFGLFHNRPIHSPGVVEARSAVLLPATQTLPDGSVVELRPGAEIVVDFEGRLRRVVMKSGEAHFRVAKNADRPFVVEAGDMDVRAIGTAFLVDLGRSQIEVLVTEGRVAVEKRAESDESDRRDPREEAVSARTISMMDAGNRIVVERTPGPAAAALLPTPVSPSEIAERLAWRAPRLEFSELPLGEAVALMNQYNQVQFLIEDGALAQLRISGVFRADNTETFARLLEGTCGIAAERVGDTLVLTKAGP